VTVQVQNWSSYFNHWRNLANNTGGGGRGEEEGQILPYLYFASRQTQVFHFFVYVYHPNTGLDNIYFLINLRLPDSVATQLLLGNTNIFFLGGGFPLAPHKLGQCVSPDSKVAFFFSQSAFSYPVQYSQ
jgi:hypothetical protein